MKHILSLSFCLILFVFISNAQLDKKVNIIPEPSQILMSNKSIFIEQQLEINFSSNISKEHDFKNYIEEYFFKSLAFKKSNSKSKQTKINFTILSNKIDSIGKEGYFLKINKEGIFIEANELGGLFYGFQTFLQILPNEIFNKNRTAKIEIPECSITDYPRFKWRGLMLDVARHFFTKDQVKQFIDNMVKYKFNLLHLHLSDDEGWRVEIKSLPKLTEVGAWRPHRVGKWHNRTNAFSYEPKTYGGFYTQEDIKELVKYAKDRFVDILPEIDVPGHSTALLAAYPFLSCSQGNIDVGIGAPFISWETYPFLVSSKDNSLNPNNPLVYEYLDKIFTEIANLFPFEYIHIGGDECIKNYWENDKGIQELMKKENLKDLEMVQSYFTRKVLKIIQSKNKKLIGWDEILDGGLDTNAAVMSWRGSKGGEKASKEHHKVVMSPSEFCYLDYCQGEKTAEPFVYAGLRLSKCYEFNPVLGTDPNYVLGGQGNIWSENISNQRTLEYLVWPRSMALAEKLWTKTENTSWNNFTAKVENHFHRFDITQTRYSTAMYDPIITTYRDAKNNLIADIKPEVSGLKIYYSLDESIPDNYYPPYTEPVLIPADVAHLKVVAYKNGKLVSKLLVIPIEELKKRVKK